jgi:hypothetical protein
MEGAQLCYRLIVSFDGAIRQFRAKMAPSAMKRDDMISSLKSLFVSALRERGFKGSMPRGWIRKLENYESGGWRIGRKRKRFTAIWGRKE